jgi:hypothetical protein
VGSFEVGGVVQGDVVEVEKGGGVCCSEGIHQSPFFSMSVFVFLISC